MCQSVNGLDAANCAEATKAGGGGVAANACVFQAGQDTRGMKFYTNELARIGCCGSTKKSACWEDISAAVCATPSDYDGAHMTPIRMTCDQVAASSGLTATKQCTDVKPEVDGPNGKQPGSNTFKQLTNHMATTYGCCGSTKKSACWEDISAAICATPGDYDGSHEFDAGNGEKKTCDQIATMTGLTSTSKQCTDKKNDKGSYTLKQTTNMLATLYGCCGSTKKSACWEDISAAVCLTPSDYDGSHEFDSGNGQKMTCDQLAAQSGITATKQCSATAKVGGPSWKQTTNYMATAYGCCGSAAKSACWVDVSAAICATPSNYDGAHEYGPPGSSSSQKVKCDTVMTQVTLSSTDATCDSTPGPMQGGQPGPSKDYITTILASVYGCCGGTSQLFTILFFVFGSVTKNIINQFFSFFIFLYFNSWRKIAMFDGYRNCRCYL